MFVHTVISWESGFGSVITLGYVSIWRLIEFAEKIEYSIIVAWIP